MENLKVGEIYEGKITKIMDYGLFVNLIPGKDGLVHISQVSNEFVKNIRDLFEVGQTLKVKILAIDPATGKINLTAKI